MSTAQQFPSNVQPIRETTPQLAALEEESLDLRRIAATLRRRKIMISAIAVIGTVVMTLYVGGITPLYKAETEIVIEPERKKIVNIDQVAQNLSSDWLTPPTEAAIIRSRDSLSASMAVVAARRLRSRRLTPRTAASTITAANATTVIVTMCSTSPSAR